MSFKQPLDKAIDQLVDIFNDPSPSEAYVDITLDKLDYAKQLIEESIRDLKEENDSEH